MLPWGLTTVKVASLGGAYGLYGYHHQPNRYIMVAVQNRETQPAPRGAYKA